MKAILLSAGFGTRLRPLTDNLPKCLVPINGKPLLQFWLEQLSKEGVTEFLINTHYLPEQVHEFIANSPFKSQITVFHEADLLGTLGTLKATESFWQNDDVLIAHADNLCLCNWTDFQQAYFQRPNECIGTMMLFISDNPQLCGIVEVDSQQRLLAFYEKVTKPPSNLANGAIYLFSGSELSTMIKQLPPTATDISIDLMPSLLGKLNTWQTDGYLRDIGNLQSLAIANEYIINLSGK